MRRFLFIAAVIGYIVFFGRAILPTLSLYYNFTAYLVMVGFAVLATVCARGTQRWFASMGLVLAIAGCVYTGHYNAERRARSANTSMRKAMLSQPSLPLLRLLPLLEVGVTLRAVPAQLLAAYR